MPFMRVVALLSSLRLWIGARSSIRKHIFTTGAPRSGTTLLKTILISHSRLGGTDHESTTSLERAQAIGS